MRKYLFAMVMVLSFLLTAVDADAQMRRQPPPPSQTLCPISGKPVEKDQFADVDGFRIMTAGPAETEQVLKDPAAAFATLAKNREAAVPVVWVCPSMGNKVTRASRYVQQDGKRIYYCCPPCLSQIKGDFSGAAEKMKQLAEEQRS